MTLRLSRPSSLLAFTLLPLAVAGCSGDDPAAPDPIGEAMSAYEAGPFTVEPGKELVMCTYVRADNEAEEDITLFKASQSKGGHHLIVYTIDHAVDLPPTECPQGGQPSWNQVLTTQLPEEEQTFPEGVGFHIKPRQQYVIETHYINTTVEPLTVESTFMTRYAEPGTVKQRAATYFFGSMNIDVPPNSSFTRTTQCAPPVPMNLHTMFGHEHRRGTGVHVEVAPAGGAMQPLYVSEDWDAPPVQLFEGGRAIGTGDTVSVTCDWDNESSERVRYPHEMCFAIGIYWPAEGGVFCASGGGKDDCTCQLNGVLDTGSGGSKVEVSLKRNDVITNAVGEIDNGAPIYCSLWRAQDWAGFFPKEGAQPYYFRDAVDQPLTSASDEVSFSFDDVTPGDYVVSCMMDTIGGGFLPGTGNVVNSMAAPVTASKEATAKAAVVLDFALP
jgi:hypothetical protein